jgi:hypothetical protein
LAARVRSLISYLLKRQLELPLCRRYLVRLGLDRLGGGVNAERLEDAQHLCGDGASMLEPLIEMQRAVPWFMRAP